MRSVIGGRPKPFTRLTQLAVSALVAAAFLLAAPRAARADLWVNKNVRATRIFNYPVYLTAGTIYRFRTTSSYPVDPVMHLWRDAPSNYEAAFNDDCNPSSNPDVCPSYGSHDSVITWTASATGLYHVFVRSYSTYSAGTGNVLMCAGSSTCTSWSYLGYGYYFGGYPVDVANSPTNSIQYQTSEIQTGGTLAGTNDTILLGTNYLSDGEYHLVAYDDDGGVGYMSQIGTASGSPNMVERLFVGAYGSDGNTNVYTNDLLYGDTDHDGVGPYLEYALGTCNSSTYPDPYSAPYGHSYCQYQPAERLRDTDGDGISDNYEVFGVDTYPWQKLPAWGASPTHKDMFFQVDRHCVEPAGVKVNDPPNGTACKDSPPVADAAFPSESNLAKMQTSYGTGSSSDLRNFDGTNGVSLHFDLGSVTCTNQLLCGPWGGGGNIVPTVSLAGTPRMNLFRRLFMITQDCHPWGDGMYCSDDGTSNGWFGYGHEMGHSLGLQHYGIDAWGGGGPTGALTCKSNYRSIMNYCTDADAARTFSSGANAGYVLDPSHVKETPALASVGYLSESSGLGDWNYPSVAGAGPEDVDFNRDRVIYNGSTGWIRGGVATAGVGGPIGYASQMLVSGVTIAPSSPPPRVTPDVVRFTGPSSPPSGRSFVFWVAACGASCGGSSTRVIFYRSDVSPGPYHNGSCSTGSGRLTDAACNTWGPSNPPYRGPDAGVYDVTGVAAMEYGGQLYVAWRTSEAGGPVYVTSATTYDGTGLLSGGAWPSATVLPETGTDTASQVELSPMYVNASNPDFGGITKTLGLFVLKGGVHEWAWLSPSNNWSTFRPVNDDTTGTALTGTAVAGVAVWPNRAPDWTFDYSATNYASACGVFTRADTTVQFRCYNRATDRWTDLSNFFGGPPVNTGRARPGIAFHTLREVVQQPSPLSVDNPTNNDASIGQFWISVSDSGQTSQLYATDRVDAYHPPSASITLRSVDAMYGGGLLDAGGALYEDGDLSALKGAAWAFDVNGGYWRLGFLPFVDGTFSANLTDGDDWRVIEGNVCRSLWPAAAQSAKCGTDTCVCGATTYWGY